MSESIPTTQHAIQLVGVDQIVHNPAKDVPVIGPHQMLVKIEATGICFSDTKLLHAFDSHPRKGEVVGGLDADVLAEIPGYVPGALPTVPGHEPVGRIVAIGDAVTRHQVGERVLIQTDYRHLPTAGSNAAFGYNFEGALQEYVVQDERVVIDPVTDERFLIPVTDAPSASAVGLLEPWATVQACYTWDERRTLTSGGKLLVLADPGTEVHGLAQLVDESEPGSMTVVGSEDVQATVAIALAGHTLVHHRAASLDLMAGKTFDDIIYFGADADEIEQLLGLLATGGILDIVTGGQRIGRPVAIDVGRVHYDLIRVVGSTGESAADGYAQIPVNGEIRAGERQALIGAAGPMGFMHTVRSAVSGVAGISLSAIDVDDMRLAHLAEVVGPLAAERGAPIEFINSNSAPLERGYSYVTCLVPVPALLSQAVDIAAASTVSPAIVNAFAGFPVGTLATVDLDGMLARHVYLIGTSGSRIVDMKAMLEKLESGALDTNISVYAVTGMAGVQDAVDEVNARTSGGKIVVYPMLAELGLTKLTDMPTSLPTVAALLQDGRWTKAAEQELMRHVG